MLEGLVATDPPVRVRGQTKLVAQLIDDVPYTGSGNIDAFLVGGCDLALEGLKTLLIRSCFNIVGVGQRLSDVSVPAMYRTERFLLIMDVTDDFEPLLEDILLLRQNFPHVCIVALLDGFQETVGQLPDNTGVNAIVDRNLACETLIKTLSVVMAGYGVLSPVARTEFDARAPDIVGDVMAVPCALAAEATLPANLSDRELEIIGCIAEGQSNKVIARRFSISEATVKIHVRGILRKVNARNRTQAAVWALHRGFGSSAVAID